MKRNGARREEHAAGECHHRSRPTSRTAHFGKKKRKREGAKGREKIEKNQSVRQPKRGSHFFFRRSSSATRTYISRGRAYVSRVRARHAHSAYNPLGMHERPRVRDAFNLNSRHRHVSSRATPTSRRCGSSAVIPRRRFVITPRLL